LRDGNNDYDGQFFVALICRAPSDRKREYMIVIRLLEGAELNEERHSSEREGNRYERVGFAWHDHHYSNPIVWPEDQETVILV
jgi:hypothetical protein